MIKYGYDKINKASKYQALFDVEPLVAKWLKIYMQSIFSNCVPILIRKSEAFLRYKILLSCLIKCNMIWLKKLKKLNRAKQNSVFVQIIISSTRFSNIFRTKRNNLIQHLLYHNYKSTCFERTKNRKYFILSRKSSLASIPILIIQRSFLDILQGYVEVKKMNRWLTIYVCIHNICTRTKILAFNWSHFPNIKYFPFLCNFYTSILLCVDR